MKLVIDMNLAPAWVGFFTREGIDAVHWSTVGDPRAEDAVVMAWARKEARVLFTHDLDFSALLALTSDEGPSVIQVRTQAVLPENFGPGVLTVLREHATSIEQGAIVSMDELTSRVRVLPLSRPKR